MSKGEPHKHADLIKMWADGWEIEEYDESWGKWVIQTSPSWSRYKEYRRCCCVSAFNFFWINNKSTLPETIVCPR